MTTPTATVKMCRLPSCGAELLTPKYCSKCRQAYYCGVDCQRLHWKEHKKECKAVTEGKEQGQTIKLRKHDNIESSEDGEDGEGYWSYHGDDDRILSEWAATMPAKNLIPGTDAPETMCRLGISIHYVKGLALGDWAALDQRLAQSCQKVKVRNNPPLKVGDFIEAVAGNHVKWECVGQRGTLEQYFKKEKKWGIRFKSVFLSPTLLTEDSLKRVTSLE
jgi:hypothetical protein